MSKTKGDFLYTLSDKTKGFCGNCNNFISECADSRIEDICYLINGEKQTSLKFTKSDLENTGKKCCAIQDTIISINGNCSIDNGMAEDTGSPIPIWWRLLFGALGEHFRSANVIRSFCEDPSNVIKKTCCDNLNKCREYVKICDMRKLCLSKINDPYQVRDVYKKWISDKFGKEFVMYLERKVQEFTEKGFKLPVKESEYCDIVR